MRNRYFNARGKTTVKSGMNQLEKRYADHLRALQLSWQKRAPAPLPDDEYNPEGKRVIICQLTT